MLSFSYSSEFCPFFLTNYCYYLDSIILYFFLRLMIFKCELFIFHEGIRRKTEVEKKNINPHNGENGGGCLEEVRKGYFDPEDHRSLVFLGFSEIYHLSCFLTSL